MSTDERSIFDNDFLNTIREWFIARQDIFVVARYSRMAGAKDYFWFKEFGHFQERLRRFPPQTEVIVFRDNQFPLRGLVTDSFIHQALDFIRDGAWAMVTNTIQPVDESISIWFCGTEAELMDTFSNLLGQYASVGPEAPLHMADNETMISALVPLERI